MNGRAIGECPIYLVETLAIREVMLVALLQKLSNIVIESDSQISIEANMDAVKVSKSYFKHC